MLPQDVLRDGEVPTGSKGLLKALVATLVSAFSALVMLVQAPKLKPKDGMRNDDMLNDSAAQVRRRTLTLI